MNRPGAAPPRWSPTRGLVLLGLNATWAAVMARFGRGDIYWVVGVHALVVLAVLVAMDARTLRRLVAPRTSDVALGLAAGLVMTLGTYAAFEAARVLFPELAAHVAQLYRAAGTRTPLVALGWTLVILTSEELLWRGVWVDAWSVPFGRTVAALTSVLAFAVTQLGSGSILVALVALVCGGVWTALRMRTGRVVASLVAHAIWTPVVILFHPVI